MLTIMIYFVPHVTRTEENQNVPYLLFYVKSQHSVQNRKNPSLAALNSEESHFYLRIYIKSPEYMSNEQRDNNYQKMKLMQE